MTLQAQIQASLQAPESGLRTLNSGFTDAATVKNFNAEDALAEPDDWAGSTELRRWFTHTPYWTLEKSEPSCTPARLAALRQAVHVQGLDATERRLLVAAASSQP